MGSFVGPNIVQDGLVAVFDAGSTRSYPGTGTVWYNLIGTVNGTLSSSSIGTTAAGTMTFDGVDDTINIPLASLASSNFTVIGVSSRIDVNGRMISGGANNWLLGHWDDYVRQYYSVGWVTGAGVAPLTTITDTNVHIWCGTGDISGSAYTLRDDNVEYTTATTSGTAGPNGFNLGNYYAGNGGLGAEFGQGIITALLVYNRVLTDAEIDQNFNAQKNRFL
jgi:hypothetical protein|tara:strand:- start:139 stop:801 length:663 start_codon:yes stop_codon:yes gene_type:complete